MAEQAKVARAAKHKAAPQATRGDGLAERLADEITSGSLAPGSRLDEESLAARYGTSRTPVREALRHLEATGLIERRPYRGAIVSAPSDDQLAEMFAAMGEIEACCARLAAMSMSASDRAALRNAHDKMASVARSNDAPAYADANAALHGRLYAGTRNRFLEGFATDLRKRLMPYRRAQFRVGDRIAQSYAEHEAIVRAIERGDGEEAATKMRHHMRVVESTFEDTPTRG